MKLVAGVVLSVAVVVLSTGHAVAQKAALPDVLKAAADYVLQYSDRLQAVNGVEDYLQLDVSGGQIRVNRKLLSDIAFVGIGQGRVITFRDVFNRDGNVLRERDGRLSKLFQSTSSDALVKAQEFSASTGRNYVSSNIRVFDEVVAPLAALRAENQSKVTFKIENVKTTDGVDVVSIKFAETGTPHAIVSPIEDGATGRIFVEATTGAVRRTELVVSNKALTLRTTVAYARNAALGLWLPSEMDWTGEISSIGTGSASDKNDHLNGHESLEGHAKYSNYQQAKLAFTVRGPQP